MAPRRLLTGLLLPLAFLGALAERRAVRSHRAPPAVAATFAHPSRKGRSAARRLSRAATLLLAASSASAARAQEGEEQSTTLLETLDADGDGKVCRAEFMTLLPAEDEATTSDGNATPKLQEIYDRMYDRADIDGDGALCPRELEFAEFLAETARDSLSWFLPKESSDMLGELNAQEMFDDVDANNDGQVDRDEYLTALRLAAPREDPELQPWADEIWARADIDGDGLWSPSELHYASYLVENSLLFEPLLEKRVLAEFVDDMMELATDGQKVSLADIEAGIEKLKEEAWSLRKENNMFGMEIMQKHFSEADSDSSGGLERQEIWDLAADIYHGKY